VLGERIDLRVYLHAWRHAYSVEVPTRRGTRKSLQFFDGFGDAVHKIYETEETDRLAWQNLESTFADAADDPPVWESAPAPEWKPREPADLRAFHEGWDALEDTHDFFMLLRAHELDRLSALRAAGPERAWPVPRGAYRTLLENATQTSLRLLVFVGNRGIHQIHAGPIGRIGFSGGWFNVLDPGFNLHVKDREVHEVWRVRKPTRHGFVNSLELFDGHGRDIAYVFSKKDRSEPESEEWRELLDRSVAGAAELS
jgi:putative hemin transport protein